MEEKSKVKVTIKSVLILIVSVIIILAGIYSAWYLMATAPVTKKRPPAPLSALVKTEKLQLEDSAVKISAMGTTIAAYTLALKPKITGIVKSFGSNYGSGYIVKKGDPLIYIENIDQMATKELADAALEQAQANLDIEIGSQAVAVRELEILKNSKIGSKLVFEEESDSDLALRKPQLKIAQANVEIAKANLDTAKNDLDYTVVKAPFNAFIDGNVTAVGMYASPTTTFCDLYFTDFFWVDATVTYETLKYLDIPYWNTNEEKGSTVEVRIKGSDGIVGTRQGYIKRMRGRLQDGDNMVRLIVQIDDPLCLKDENKGKEMVLLNSKVDMEIHAKKLSNVYEIPRNAWREDREIWIVGEGQKLKRLTPKLIWRTKNTVFIDPEGIPENADIITSNLSLAVDGLSLNILGDETLKAQAKPEAKEEAKKELK